MNIFSKIFTLILATGMFCVPVFAYNLDLSVDDEIRKNYNPSALESELPPLPQHIRNSSQGDTSNADNSQSQNVINPANKVEYSKEKEVVFTPPTAKDNILTIRKGAKVRVKLQNKISDTMPKGAKITFATNANLKVKKVVLPAGTKFIGTIEDAHAPQFTGNGGLVVIRVHSIVYGGKTQLIDATITKANNKKIFFNNVKGARKYFKNMCNAASPGARFFNKMMKITGNLAKDGGSIILTPFSMCAGVVAFGVNAVVSPVMAIFTKGGSLTIPVGSDFEIKFREDAMVHYH